VAVKIKLKRLGKIRAPYYRIVVADARTKRDGRAIEEIGKYHPKAEPSFIEVNSDRAQHWLSVGAQPTDPVRKILEITGDWQKFKGLPGAEGTLKTAPPKEDRKEIFAAAVKETLGAGGATTKSRGKSGAGRDADSGADKSGKPEKPGKADQSDKAAKADKDAGAGRGGRQARAKSGEQSGKAAAKSGGDAAAKGKSEGAAEAPAAEAPAAEAPAAEAPGADATSADAASADAAAADAAGDAAQAKAEPAAADAESASGD
jgi:small subunit ribosomal protein S16